jgi:hypothetical protein
VYHPTGYSWATHRATVQRLLSARNDTRGLPGRTQRAALGAPRSRSAKGLESVTAPTAYLPDVRRPDYLFEQREMHRGSTAVSASICQDHPSRAVGETPADSDTAVH